MKLLLLVAIVFLTSCASQDRFPTMPFTFIGVPEKLSDETYMNVHGLERGLSVRVLEMKKGSYDHPSVVFGIPAEPHSPLVIGRKYRIEAAWGRHGMLLVDAKLIEEPNKTLAAPVTHL